MPEFFDISLIAKKSYSPIEFSQRLAEEIKFLEWKKEMHILDEESIIISKIEGIDADFDEVIISIKELQFHKDFFDTELSLLTKLINLCFVTNSNIKYALCSYELNGYLIADRKSIDDFDDNLFSKFPIVYKKDPYDLSIHINFKAQDIFG